jgi:hypothetical protein
MAGLRARPPRVEQALSRGLPHLLERAIDAGARIRHDLVEPGRRIGWRAFCPQRGFLIGVQRVATRVGEQAIGSILPPMCRT